MKAILEFNLPEEIEEHLNAINGINYKIALQEMDRWLRSVEKNDLKPSLKVIKSYFYDTIQDIKLYD